MKTIMRMLVLSIISIVTLAACGSGAASPAAPAAPAGTESAAPAAPAAGAIKLTLAAYTTPREAYRELIPIFQKQWKEKTGQDVTFEESYLGSGAQSRAVVEGFEADIVALSLEADVIRIQKAGLITHNWKSGPTKGMVSDSIVVFAVRPGNPKGIEDWDDLAKPGLEILTPNVKTSGGAMWNILALYGAAKRGYIDGVAKDDDTAATDFMLKVLNNVTVMDKGARESITNYEKGIGDLAITYENEVLVGRLNGQQYDMVIPRSTILIENPIAVVDTYADKHGVREAAEAFVAFTLSPEAQEIFARYGLRSVDAGVAQKTAAQYPPVEDQFTIDEYFGGWSNITDAFFGEQGIYTLTVAKIQKLNP